MIAPQSADGDLVLLCPPCLLLVAVDSGVARAPCGSEMTSSLSRQGQNVENLVFIGVGNLL